jgi:hypothetical protein
MCEFLQQLELLGDGFEDGAIDQRRDADGHEFVVAVRLPDRAVVQLKTEQLTLEVE